MVVPFLNENSLDPFYLDSFWAVFPRFYLLGISKVLEGLLCN